MSNTSIVRGKKGSKFWMQTLATIGKEHLLQEMINQLPEISTITWESPKKNNGYKELRTKNVLGIKDVNLKFWPDNGPWWDAVGIADDGTILLVEAKAHISETLTKCKAKADSSKKMIKVSLMKTHSELAEGGHIFDYSVWYSKYYQLANRFTFLRELSKQDIKVKLVLLNIVNDPTYIKTSDKAWDDHYKEVFFEMLGTTKKPNDIVILNIDVG